MDKIKLVVVYADDGTERPPCMGLIARDVNTDTCTVYPSYAPRRTFDSLAEAKAFFESEV
jgi:hypothetical protein